MPIQSGLATIAKYLATFGHEVPRVQDYTKGLADRKYLVVGQWVDQRNTDSPAVFRPSRGRNLPRGTGSQLTTPNQDIVLPICYERSSVAREGVVLSAALELHPDFYRWRELRHALETHPDAIRKDGEMTLHMIRREETATVQRVMTGRNQRFAMGDAAHLPTTLTAGQQNAAHSILGSRDFMSVLIGDAGTGKTTVLTAIEGAPCGGRTALRAARADNTGTRCDG